MRAIIRMSSLTMVFRVVILFAVFDCKFFGLTRWQKVRPFIGLLEMALSGPLRAYFTFSTAVPVFRKNRFFVELESTLNLIF